MRVDALHRRFAPDVLAIQSALAGVMPARMPKGLDTHDVNIRQWITKLNPLTASQKVIHLMENHSDTAVGNITAAGEWLGPGERVGGCDVAILYHMNPATKRFRWTNAKWNRRRFYYYQTLMHELIHRYQPSADDDDKTSRKYTPTALSAALQEQQAYLGDCDEIETYAHDTALELITFFPGMTFGNAMRKAKNTLYPEMASVSYPRTFENDPNHPALLHYRRKASAWFDLMHSKPDFYGGLELTKF